MSDIEGFVVPVFMEHGATRVVETWGDDVPPRATRADRATVRGW